MRHNNNKWVINITIRNKKYKITNNPNNKNNKNNKKKKIKTSNKIITNKNKIINIKYLSEIYLFQ